mgnify:CR=1 FL=1
MLQTTNFNQANVCALYNKGVNARAVALDSLISKYEKKMENYLVVPDICILSLSQSRRKLHIFLLSYAREACRKASKQRTFRKFPLFVFSCPSLRGKDQNKKSL